MMKKLVIALALASAATVAAPVAAQTLPPAVIVVVNLDQVFQTSTAGKTAQTELKTRLDAIQARLATLRTSFGAEEQTLAKSQPAQGAPEATIKAWQAKVQDFTTRKTQAEQELQKRDQDFQASRQFVLKQINDGAQPIITQIMKERGASIALPKAPPCSMPPASMSPPMSSPGSTSRCRACRRPRPLRPLLPSERFRQP